MAAAMERRAPGLASIPVPSGLTSWQFEIASGLLKRSTASASELASAIDRFPLQPADGRPETNFRKAAYDVIALQVTLHEAGEQLQGSSLEPSISAAVRLAQVAAPRLRALALSITLEDRSSKLNGRSWTWSGAAAAFNAYVLPTLTEPAQCGWEMLVDGGYLHELDDAIHSLIQAAMELVMAPPQPEHVSNIIRRGSAHEEHVRGSRKWCALCGWLDAIGAPSDTQRIYHFGFAHTMPAGQHN